MTFKHKLSARLARLKDLVAVAALAATACQQPVALTTPGGDPVTQLVVLPKSLTVHPTQTAQLMAVAFTASGDTGSIDVSWSVTGGTIIETSRSGGRHYGRFQAGSQAGTFDVVALGSPGALADTAVVVVTTVPVASVTVTPAVVSVLVGASVQLAAVAKDSAGNALAGRVVTWASSAPTVATVNSTGLVTAAAAGSATVTASSEGQNGSSAVTVAVPPPPAGGSCLTQAGPTITLSGARAAYNDKSLSSNTKIDARTASWTGTSNNPVQYGSGSNVCWSGGTITGRFPDGTSWSAYHDAYSMVIYSSPGTVIEGVRIHNYGDGPNFNNAGSDGWTVRGNHLSYMHDDCVSNDFGNSGLVEDNLIDGCYVGYSSRAYSGVSDNSTKVVTFRSNLWRLQDMPTGYSSPGHGKFWKMNSSDGSGTDPRLALHDNIFRIDTPANCCGNFLIPPAAYLASCSNNIMVWLGPGDFPEPVPSCFTLTRDKSVWDNAVADWLRQHPNVPP